MAAHGILQWLRLLASATGPARPDHELVSRFVEVGDQAAFTVLVQRHGPMVYGVCQRLLEHGQDAEDAFQATFLVFARKARSIRKHASVSCWLYGVASRVAANLRRKTARERRHETVQLAAPDVAAAEVSWREVRTVLDEELAKLPERLRLPVVLCYLDGKTRDEAAHELAVSESTLRGRLERGRDLLRGRLTSRGVTLSAALLASLLSENAASALPASLVASTVNAAGKPLAGVVSAKVIGLVLMEVNAMFVSKLIHVAVVVCAAALVLGGVAAGTGALLREEPAKEAPVAQKKAEEQAKKADAGEDDYFVRGDVGKGVAFPGDNEEMPKVNAYGLRNAIGNGIPKGTKIIIAIRKETKIEEVVGKGRKEVKRDKDEPRPPFLRFRTTIAIARTSVEQIKKQGETWWIEPTAVLILKEVEHSVPDVLAANEIKPADSDDELRKLLVEKHNAGAREVEYLNACIMAGKIVFSDASIGNDFISSIQRFTDTKLELADSPAERISARRRCVEALEDVENECYYQWRLGKLSEDRYQRTVQARVEAEIQLLKEQRRAK
jgi:RNA polymerase sigma factor (sigma-70 family)